MSGFDIDAMKKALIQCDENIKVFEKAIEKEINTKMEYKRIIRELEYQRDNPPVIEIVVEKNSTNDID